MEYLIVFVEGIITFLSPCLLPMLPLYLCYFAGQNQQASLKKTLVNACGFVLGFSIVFTALGAFAGTLGSLLLRYQTAVNLISGAIVILIGLNYTGWLNLPFINGSKRMKQSTPTGSFLSTLLFGMIFSIGWTPCVGAFLGSALLLASQQASLYHGMALLFVYSLGLGIPFLLSALLLDYIQEAFSWIKQRYDKITVLSGIFLILMGILMMTGWLSRLTGLFQ